MLTKNALVKGTFLLTFSGFFCRFLGFFYRIFLSHTFGEEGVGLYQLIFPVYTFCFAITSSGLQAAISRSVAQKHAHGKDDEALGSLKSGLFLSLFLSFLCLICLQHNSSFIALHLLHDTRCAGLITPLSYAIPLAAVHSCIIGYCYGMKNAKIPAISQILESIVRILTVYILYGILSKHTNNIPISITVLGLAAGELASTIFCLVKLSNLSSKDPETNSFFSIFARLKELLQLSTPLTLNRITITLLTGIEGISIPVRLQLYGHTLKESLSLYGVLTGMALPCILFPSAISNSLAVLLMPEIASCQSCNNKLKLKKLVFRSLTSCFILGLICCLFFLILGPLIGTLLFKSQTAGNFIMTLAWICPFLYINTTLLSILNGLGKVTLSFIINSLGLFIRILGVFWGISSFGIPGYLHGLLISQLFVTILSFMFLFSTINSQK